MVDKHSPEEQEERTKQGVTVSDHAQTGDITLIGKIINVVNQPVAWQESILAFVNKNQLLLFILVLVEAVLIVIYLEYKDLYRLSIGFCALAVALSSMTIWGLYYWRSSSEFFCFFTVLIALSFIYMIYWIALHNIYAEHFDSNIFGIALAEIGEGPDYRASIRSRELTDQIYNRLLDTFKEELSSEPSNEQKKIAIRQIGVISSQDEAIKYGVKIGAKIVIWGHMLTSGSNCTTIRFYTVETFDKVNNLDFPLVLPVKTKSTDITIHQLDENFDPVKIKLSVTQQSELISSFALGLIYYLEQKFSNAIPKFKFAVDASNQAPNLGGCGVEVENSNESKGLLYYYLGMAYTYVGNIEEGKKQLLYAEQMNPEEPAIPLNLAFIYKSLGIQSEYNKQLSLAFDRLKGWLDNNAKDEAATAIYDRGIAYDLSEDPESAIIDYQHVIKLNSKFYIAYSTLGHAYAKLGHFDQAIDILHKAISDTEITGTNNATAWFELGRVQEKAGNLEEAEKSYKEATERAPQVPWTYFYYAQLLEKKCKLEKECENDVALIAYQTMVEVADNKAWANQQAGDFARRIDLLSQALIHYKQAVQADQKSALLQTYLAETYYALGDFKNAWMAFEKAIVIDGDLYYTYSSYAWHLHKQHKDEKAIEMYEKAIALQPTEEQGWQNLANIYIEQGQCQKARAIYSKILLPNEHFSQQAIQEAKNSLEKFDVLCKTR